jgi:hypothetical protein
MHIPPTLRLYSCCIAVLLLPGCLITTQSFNHGRLLNPGERIMTHAVGGRRSSPLARPDYYYDDSAGHSRLETTRDSTRYNWTTYTFDYRVGVLRKYPFGKGLETGFHVEAAFRGLPGANFKFYGPPVLEFDTRFGLPDIIVGNSIFHHNVNAGWMVGYWVDNGWFAGYAAGWEFEHFIPYLSARVFLTATDALTKPIMSDFFTQHDRTWGGRITAGVSYKLPYNYSIIPEIISPEVSFTFPNYSTGQHVGVNAAVGIRWMLGQ